MWGQVRSDGKAPTGGCAAFKRGRNGLTRRAACQWVTLARVGGTERGEGWAVRARWASAVEVGLGQARSEGPFGKGWSWAGGLV